MRFCVACVCVYAFVCLLVCLSEERREIQIILKSSHRHKARQMLYTVTSRRMCERARMLPS